MQIKWWFEDLIEHRFDVTLKSNLGRERSGGASNNNPLTLKQLFDTLDYFGSECPYCGVAIIYPLKDGTLCCSGVLDHIVPVSKGGRFVKHNILMCCQTCNGTKHSMDKAQWLKRIAPERARKVDAFIRRRAF